MAKVDDIYIDLSPKEARYLIRHRLDPVRDTDFLIACKLNDALRENGHREVIMKEATMGTKQYADEGVRYYKKAARAQMAIGISSIVQALAVIAIALLLASCAAPASRPSTAVIEPVAVTPIKGRIDAPTVLEAADAAGCDLATMLYSEGKRDSKLVIQCNLGMKLPPAPQGF